MVKDSLPCQLVIGDDNSWSEVLSHTSTKGSRYVVGNAKIANKVY